jgi:hypothetical protein
MRGDTRGRQNGLGRSKRVKADETPLHSEIETLEQPRQGDMTILMEEND